MSEQKRYFGNVKEQSGQFGTFQKISFKREELEEMLTLVNDRGYINLNLNRRKEVSQYGNTHSIVLDTWQPNQQQAPQQAPISQAQQDAVASMPNVPAFDDFGGSDDSDCPFNYYEKGLLI